MNDLENNLTSLIEEKSKFQDKLRALTTVTVQLKGALSQLNLEKEAWTEEQRKWNDDIEQHEKSLSELNLEKSTLLDVQKGLLETIYALEQDNEGLEARLQDSRHQFEGNLDKFAVQLESKHTELKESQYEKDGLESIVSDLEQSLAELSAQKRLEREELLGEAQVLEDTIESMRQGEEDIFYQLKLIKEEKTILEENVVGLQEKNYALEKVVRKLRLYVLGQKEKYDQFYTLYNDLSHKFERLQIDSENLKRDNQNEVQLNLSLKEAIDNFQGQIVRLNKEKEEMLHVYEVASQRIVVLEQALVDKDVYIEDLEEKENQFLLESQGDKKVLAHKLMAYGKDVESLRQENDILYQKNENLVKQGEDLVSTLEDMRYQEDILRSEKEELLSYIRSLDERLEELLFSKNKIIAEKEQVQIDLGRSQEIIGMFNQKESQWNIDRQSLQEDNHALVLQIDALEGDKEKLLQFQEKMKTVIFKLRSALKTVHEEKNLAVNNYDVLQNDMDKMRLRVQDMTEHQKDLIEALTMLKRQFNLSQEDLKKTLLVKDVLTLAKERADQDILDNRQKMEEVIQQKSKAEEENKALVDSLSEVKKNLEIVLDEKLDLETIYGQLSQDMVILKDKYIVMREDNQNKDRQIQEGKGRIKTLQLEISSIQKEKEEVESHFKALKEKALILKETLNKFVLEIDSLKELSYEKDQKIMKFFNENQLLSQKRVELESALALLQEQFNQISEEQGQIQMRNQSLQNNLIEEENKSNLLKEEVHVLEQDNEKLEERIRRKDEELLRIESFFNFCRKVGLIDDDNLIESERRIYEFLEERHVLRETLKNFQNDKQRVKEHVSSLEDQVKGLHLQNDKLLRENKLFKDKILQDNERVKVLKEKVEKVDSQHRRLHLISQALKLRVGEDKDNLSSLNKERDQFILKIDNLKEESLHKNSRLEDFESQIGKAKRDYVALESTVVQLEDTMNQLTEQRDLLRQYSNEYLSENRSLKEENLQLKSQNHTLSQSEREVQEAISQLKLRLKDTESEYFQIQQKMSILHTDHKNVVNEKQKVEGDFQKVLYERDHLRNNYEEILKEMEAYKVSFDDISEDYKVIQDSYHKLETELQAMSIELRNYEELKDREKEYKLKIGVLEEYNEKHQDKIDRLYEEIGSSREEWEKVNQSLKERVTTLEEDRKNLATLCREGHMSKDNLEEEMKNMEFFYDKQTKENEMLKQKSKKDTFIIEEGIEKISYLSQINGTLENQLKEEHDQNVQLKRDVKHLAGELKESEEREVRYQESLLNLEEKQKELVKNLSAIEDSNRGYIKSLEESRKKIEVMRLSFDDKVREIQSLKAEKEKLQESIVAWEGRYSELERKFTETVEEKENLLEINQRLYQKIQELDPYQEEVEILGDKIDILENRLKEDADQLQKERERAEEAYLKAQDLLEKKDQRILKLEKELGAVSLERDVVIEDQKKLLEEVRILKEKLEQKESDLENISQEKQKLLVKMKDLKDGYTDYEKDVSLRYSQLFEEKQNIENQWREAVDEQNKLKTSLEEQEIQHKENQKLLWDFSLKNENLEEELNVFKKDYEDLKEEVELLRNFTKEKEDDIVLMKEKWIQLREDYQILKKDNESVRQLYEESSQKYQTQQSSYLSLEENYENLKQEYEIIHQNFSESQSVVQDQAFQISALQLEKEDIQKSAWALSLEQDQYEKSLKGQQDLLSAFKSKVAEEQNKVVQKENDIKALEEEILSLKGQLKDRDELLKPLNTKNKSLEEAFKAHLQKVEILQGEKEEVEEKLQDIYKDYGIAEQNVKDRQEKLVQLLQSQEGLEEQLLAKEGELKILRQELAVSQEELGRLSDVQKINTQLIERVKVLSQEKDVLIEEKDLIDKFSKRLEKDIEERETEFEKMSMSYSELKDKVQKQVEIFETVEEALVDKNNQNQVLKGQESEFQREREVLYKESDRMKAELESQEVEIERLSMYLRQTESEKIDLDKRIRELQEVEQKFIALTETFETLKSHVIQREGILKSLEEEKEGLRKNFEKTKLENAALQEEILSLEGIYGESQEQARGLLLDFQDIQERYRILQEKNARIIEENENLENLMIETAHRGDNERVDQKVDSDLLRADIDICYALLREVYTQGEAILQGKRTDFDFSNVRFRTTSALEKIVNMERKFVRSLVTQYMAARQEFDVLSHRASQTYKQLSQEKKKIEELEQELDQVIEEDNLEKYRSTYKSFLESDYDTKYDMVIEFANSGEKDHLKFLRNQYYNESDEWLKELLRGAISQLEGGEEAA